MHDLNNFPVKSRSHTNGKNNTNNEKLSKNYGKGFQGKVES